METYYVETGLPFSGRRLALLKDFLGRQELEYDDAIEYSVMLLAPSGRILATGSRHHNVLMCLAVDPCLQGEGYLNVIMTYLFTEAWGKSCSHLFLFTKPSNEAVFSSLGFYPVWRNDLLLFMENKEHGITDYLRQEAGLVSVSPPGAKTGAIVMNANPFTNGHLALIQAARKECEVLHVFVLSADKGPFPPEDRRRLVTEGCARLKGVYVHGTSDYLISYATFPDYFVKDKRAAVRASGELDLEIFCQYFAPAFGITVRYVGEEPLCPVTAAYNLQMQKILPAHGIEVRVIPRLTYDSEPISATTVRRYYYQGDYKAIRPLVPPATYAYLMENPQEEFYET